jgi:hypothetical protein
MVDLGREINLAERSSATTRRTWLSEAFEENGVPNGVPNRTFLAGTKPD